MLTVFPRMSTTESLQPGLLHGKSNFTEKLHKDLEVERLSWSNCVPNLIT